MNIVLIVVDTLRYDYIAANGNDRVQTPNLDRLCAESWCFDRAFCGSFPTIPHRRDVMTGRSGRPFHAWRPLPHDALTLPWILAGRGYVTQLIHDTPHLVNGGHNFDWPFHAWTFVRGAEVDRPWIDDRDEWPDNWGLDPMFDALGDRPGRSAHLQTHLRANRDRRSEEDWNCARLFRTSSRFLKQNASRENLFLWVDCFDPHEPWDAPPEYVLRYDDTPGYDGRFDPRTFAGRSSPDLDDAARRRIAAYYAAKVTWMDRWLGELLDTLDSPPLRDKTAVVLTADHGTNVQDYGRFGKGMPVREPEGHVPLIVRTPERDAGRSSVLAAPQDVFATVLGLAGAPVPRETDAHDVLATARTGASAQRSLTLAGQPSLNAGGAACTAFNTEWCLVCAPRAEDSVLYRLGAREPVQDAHPDVVAAMHAAAIDELELRGADPRRLAQLRMGLPADANTGSRGPEGYYQYFFRAAER